MLHVWEYFWNVLDWVAGAVAPSPTADMTVRVSRDVGVIAVWPDEAVGARSVVQMIAINPDIGVIGIQPDPQRWDV